MTLIYAKRSKLEDIPTIMTIVNEAKNFLKSSGSTQWQSGYPNFDTIKNDINLKQAWNLIVNNKLVAYTACVIGKDPNYQEIDGAWKNNKDTYATIHRTAVSAAFRKKGLASNLINQIISIYLEKGIYNFRIDTGKINYPMQHIAESHGFIFRGYIKIIDEPLDPVRLAYELNL